MQRTRLGKVTTLKAMRRPESMATAEEEEDEDEEQEEVEEDEAAEEAGSKELFLLKISAPKGPKLTTGLHA